MNKISPQTILVISKSNIFFESIKRILIFTLKTDFIQKADYSVFYQNPEKLKSADLLIIDYRFRNDIDIEPIEHLVNKTPSDFRIYIFVDFGCDINSTESIRVFKPDTKLKYLSEPYGNYFNMHEDNSEVKRNSLTKKENKIAELIYKGMNNKQIAKNQNISEKTVKAHLTNIYRKLNIKNRFELMLNANRM